MKKSDSQNTHRLGWRDVYRAAIFETNDDEMVRKISRAEDAIAERVRELFRGTGEDVEGEREALDDAMYMLRAWKTAIENRTHAA